MSKKKGHGRMRHAGPPRPATSWLGELGQAENLMAQQRWEDALEILEPLSQRHPAVEAVIRPLAVAYYQLHDVPAYVQACEQLVRLTPNDPETLLALMSAYVSDQHFALALRAARRFLERWPNHAEAGEARKLVGALEADLAASVQLGGLAGDEGLETLGLHEQALVLVERGKYAEARQMEERVLRRAPGFVPALNTLSMSYAMEWRLEQAIAYSRRAVEREPDNVHALSNLTRQLCLAGQIEEARATAARLKASASTREDAWVKKAEALSMLGDDAGVMEAYAEGQRLGYTKEPVAHPLGLHLAAVAAWRLGREREARGLWQRALRASPGFELAEENLDDLKKPVGERHAPWPYSFAYWVSQQTVLDLLHLVEGVRDPEDQEALARANERFLQRHPNIAGLIPLLLDHGDPAGREFALRLAQAARTPDLLAALRDFVLSQRGPDEMRAGAASTVVEAGLLPAGPTRIWIRGNWQDVILIGFQITDEPEPGHSPQTQSLMEQAMDLMRTGGQGGGEANAERARQLLLQALEIEPDSPSIQNNLAAALEMLGRSDEAMALLDRISERYPDYLFARVARAIRAARRGDVEGGRALLDPLMRKTHLHISEFRALANAQIELAMAAGNLDAARSWLNIWEQIDPDHPSILMWSLQLAGKRLGRTRARKPASKPARKRLIAAPSSGDDGDGAAQAPQVARDAEATADAEG
jgi:tetratricopeptide (TPR) repeat protein